MRYNDRNLHINHLQFAEMEKVFFRSQYPDVETLEGLSSNLSLPVEKICVGIINNFFNNHNNCYNNNYYLFCVDN